MIGPANTHGGLAPVAMLNSISLTRTTPFTTIFTAKSNWAALGTNGKYHFLGSMVFTRGAQVP